MDVEALIDSYVDDVVRRLPRKQRADIALELRTLLADELQARADTRGSVLDAEIALEGLRAFGRPADVAARYLDPWVVIPQAETRRFVFAAIVGAAVLVALSPFEPAATRGGQVGLAFLAWLGTLVAFFGIKSLHRRHRPAADPWMPRDPDRAHRCGSVALVAIIAIGIVAYGAPGCIDAVFAAARPMGWLDFDPAFSAWRLPVLFALWTGQAIVYATLALRGRWNATLRRADLALEVGVVLVLVWFLVAGPVFRQDAADTAARTALSVFVLLMLVDVGAKRYQATSRPTAVERLGRATT